MLQLKCNLLPFSTCKEIKIILSNLISSSYESHTDLSVGTSELPSISSGTEDVTLNATLIAKMSETENFIYAET